MLGLSRGDLYVAMVSRKKLLHPGFVSCSFRVRIISHRTVDSPLEIFSSLYFFSPYASAGNIFHLHLVAGDGSGKTGRILCQDEGKGDRISAMGGPAGSSAAPG